MSAKRPQLVQPIPYSRQAVEDWGRDWRDYALTLGKAAGPVIAGFTYDPGTSDLDDEQPIIVRMTLGEYRRLRALLGQKGGGR